MAQVSQVVIENLPNTSIEDLLLFVSKIIPESAVAHCDFQHQDTCPALQGGGLDVCKCDPIPRVTVQLEEGPWEIPDHLIKVFGIHTVPEEEYE